MNKPNEISLKVQNYPFKIQRLDKWISEVLNIFELPYQDDVKNKTYFSRTKIKNLIVSGSVFIDELEIKNPSFKINKQNVVRIIFPEIKDNYLLPEKIPLNIIYEDKYLIVVNKNSDFVVHPSPGHENGTLVNAVLHHCGDDLLGIGGVKRPGIVHRLDKDTSGLMIVAKNELTHIRLTEMFKNREIDRIYNSLVWNTPNTEGIIDKPIGRSKFNRKKMAINPNGKKAITHWKLLRNFSNISSLISCRLETGRTHQIRVHMSSIGHSLVGDKIYSGHIPKEKYLNHKQKHILKICKNFNRQALHSSYIKFSHPITLEKIEFNLELPEDIKELIKSIS